MFVLDTNVISDLVRNPAGKAADRIADVGEERIATSVVVAGELRYGCRRKGSPRLTERVEAILRSIPILPLKPEVAAHYGDIRDALERRGLSVGQNDLWIAAQTRCAEAVLVSDDRGFGGVEGLVVENWLRP